MSRHIFTTRIGRTGILRSVLVPAEIANALGGAARIPVLARYGGETTRSTLAPAGGAKRRLVLQMAVLRAAKLDKGDMIEISLEPATGSHKQPLPPDLARALQFRPAAAAELDRASPSTWRILLERIEEARTPETRERRIERAVERLAEMAAARAPATSRCELMTNPEKRKAVDKDAASIAGGFPKGVAKPALRALFAAGLKSLDDLRTISEAELANFHGMGPKALAALRGAMAQRGISFR